MRKDQNLRRDRVRLLHHFAEAGRLHGRLVPLGHRCGSLGLLRPASDESRHRPALLCTASRGRPAGWAGALGVGRRLAARNGIGLVIIGPVVKAGGEAGAACLAASPNGIIVQGGRPQAGVVKVVRLAVGGELALRPRGPGRRMKKGVLIEDMPTGQEPTRKSSATRKKKRSKAYHGRGVGTRVWLLAILPLLGELAVGDVVHHV